MKIPVYKKRPQVFPYRIWQQIFIFLVLLVLVPLLLLGAVITQTSQKAIKTAVLNDRQELVVHATGEIRAYIQNARDTLTVLASLLGTYHADLWRQETALVELALHDPDFQRISVLDLSGEEIVTSKLGTALQSRASEDAYSRILNGEVFYSSEVTLNKDDLPVMTLSLPVRREGKLVSVLVADINVRGVWELVDGIRVGKTGRAYLVDSRGRLLSHPDKKLILQHESLLNPIIVRNLLTGQTGEYEEIDKKGKRWLVAYAPIKILDWGLVIFQPVREAYIFSNLLRQQCWKFVLLIIGSAILISFILSYFLTRPIRRLVAAMQQVSEGELDVQLEEVRRDEIGDLFKSFNRMTAKLKEAKHTEKLSTIGKAATAIAHELKNSLVMVHAYIDLLPERHMNRKFIQDFSKNVSEELDSWKTMLQNMMEYSKFFKFELKELDLRTLMTDIKSLACQRAQQKGVDFMLHIGPDIPFVIGNAGKIKEVLMNLINNATEATPPGGSITVAVDALPESEGWARPHVRIRVIDSGEGILPEDLKKIFEPFFSTKESGLGLGLAISKKIIEYHGGIIEAKNGLSKGAVFTIRLPEFRRRKSQDAQCGGGAHLTGRFRKLR